MTPLEEHRLREGMQTLRRCSTHDWRFYFTYLLGRSVSLAETESFLQDEARAQRSQQELVATT